METLTQDLRFAFRSIAKAPGFAAVAVLTLALGIGANTAIYSLIDRVFFRSLPFEKTGEILRLYGEAPERNLTQLNFSVPKFEHFRDNQTVFNELAADQGGGLTLTGLGDPVQVNADKVTSNYFRVLGVQPMLGRFFRPEEEEGEKVAVVSRGFWAARLNSDPNVLGRVLTLDGEPHTIIGVIADQPIAYFGPNEIWTAHPFEFPGLTRELRMRGVSFLRVIGRLKPGVTAAQAQQAVVALAESYRAANAEKADSSWKGTTISLLEDSVGTFRPAFVTLLAAVGFVLLIASCNVANLLLVRFAARRREIAVRSALGAARSRVVRLFLTESVLVSLAAAGLGTLLAWWGLQLLPKLGSPLPLAPAVSLNLPVLALTAFVALATGLAMGLYPAWQAARTDVVSALKDSGRGNTASREQHRFRTSLLGGQVALSFVLLVSALLLMASFVRLLRQNVGFAAEHLLVSSLNLPATRYPDAIAQHAFIDRLLTRVRTLPGVQSAAISVGVPFTGADSASPYARADGAVVPYTQRPLGLMRSLAPGYFSTLGIPLVAGRDFTADDRTDSQQAIIISQATAKKLFPNEDAVGRRLLVGSIGGGQSAEIIGVVGDVRSVSLAQENPVEFYRPLTQRGSAFLQLTVRAAGGDAKALVAGVRAALHEIDPEMPLTDPQTMTEIMSASLGQQRLLMSLLGLFAGFALLLAAVGIYSVVAYMVGQRTSEIGVRMALGAHPRDVLALILRQGMKPVLFGLGGGLAGSLLVGRLLSSQLYGISAFNPLLLAATGLVLALVATTACWLPARRAARIDPLTALRSE